MASSETKRFEVDPGARPTHGEERGEPLDERASDVYPEAPETRGSQPACMTETGSDPR